LLYARADLGAITAWAAAGGRWRIAVVSLDSGRLRYVTETGAVLERDGSPVRWAGVLSPACERLKNQVDALETDLRSRQQDLKDAVGSGKPGIAAEIRALQIQLRGARSAFGACVAAQPRVPLIVDVREAVMASASIPGIFRTTRLGDETYVDGGIREITPLQVAVDLGADEIYAISASPLVSPVHPPGTFAQAGLVDVVGRAMLDLLLNEIDLDDLRPEVAPGAPAPSLSIIAPDVEVHDMTTIDPGLIQINRDYGWMRAADVLDAVVPGSDRWTSADAIAVNRLETWRAENGRYGHEDPTRLAEPVLPADPSAQAAVDAGKTRLGQLLAARRAQGGPVPGGIDRWTSELERHPWSASLPGNDAVFLAQSVPGSMATGQRVPVSVTMLNTGSTTWSEATGHRLGSQAPQDNTTWGAARQVLPAPVPPGQQVTISFSVTAPPGPNAVFQWRMVQELREWFGAFTPALTVQTESAECAALRTDIGTAVADIAALRRTLSTLNPRDPVDRMDMKEIREQITATEKVVEQLRTRSDSLGCAP
jgi:hypothetical protein